MADKKQNKKETISIRIELIIIGILLIFVILSIPTRGFSQFPFNLKVPFTDKILGEETLDKEEVKEKLTKYINEELLQGQGAVEITDIVEDEDDDLYKIKLLLNDQEYESFVSKDGKYLYIERYEVTTEEQVAEYPKKDIPDVLLFTMSYCPYGNEAENFVRPVYDLLGNSANIEPHYVIYSSAQGYEGKEYCLDNENKYCSMHGVGELNQDVRELCVFKYQRDKFWDFVMAANTQCDSTNVDKCWEGIAEDTGVDIEKVKSCQANEAIALLEQEVELNEQYGVTGSPTILINEQSYGGNRTPESFKNAVCASFNNEPGECAQTLEDTGDEAEGGSCS